MEDFLTKIKNIFISKNILNDDLIIFTKNLIDKSISKNLSINLLDKMDTDIDSFINLVLDEYNKMVLVLSITNLEYPELFNRRIYIPIRYNLKYLSYAVLASLRIDDFEEFYLRIDNKNYKLNELESISAFDLRDFSYLCLVYGSDLWNFNIKLIGLSSLKDNEVNYPYIVEDGVGYGISYANKKSLYSMLDESIDLSTETKNPLIDDEEFQFYDLDIDSLNENSINDFNKIKEFYNH